MATPDGYSTTFVECPAIQEHIDQAWQNGITPNDQAPVTEYLTSPENRRPVEQLILPAQGNVRKVQLRYNQRLQEDQAVLNVANPKCAATTEIGNRMKEYTFDPTKNISFDRLLANDFLLTCQDAAAEVAETVRQLVDVMDRRVASEITTKAAALVGKWDSSVPVDGSDLLNVIGFNAQGQLNPRAWPTIRNAMDDTGFSPNRFLAGGQSMRDLFQLSNAACCTNTGNDLAELFAQYGYAAAYDKRLAAALGTQDEFLAFDQGAVQVLSWSRAQARGV